MGVGMKRWYRKEMKMRKEGNEEDDTLFRKKVCNQHDDIRDGLGRKIQFLCNSRFIIIFRNLKPLGVEGVADNLRKGVMFEDIIDR